ncbi:titin homolog [Ptychodera flava]|uniref:titin homolog n=1 Tax=Ptychodera flava TaxID=63121 RepID=UPI00396A7E1D
MEEPSTSGVREESTGIYRITERKATRKRKSKEFKHIEAEQKKRRVPSSEKTEDDSYSCSHGKRKPKRKRKRDRKQKTRSGEKEPFSLVSGDTRGEKKKAKEQKRRSGEQEPLSLVSVDRRGEKKKAKALIKFPKQKKFSKGSAKGTPRTGTAFPLSKKRRKERKLQEDSRESLSKHKKKKQRGKHDAGFQEKKFSKGSAKGTPRTGTAFPLSKKRRKERKPKTNKEPDTRILSKLWTQKNKRKRAEGELAITTRIDRIIPKQNNTIEEVDASFYSLKRTKENSKLVEKQLNHRYKTMEVKRTEGNSISYIMDCKSQEDLESFMEDYSSGRLHGMMESTFLYNELLNDIGAIYISLETSIDYEEYLLCEEELALMADANVHQLDSRDQNTSAGNIFTGLDLQQMSHETIVELNEKLQSEINKTKIHNNVLEQSTSKAASDKTLLKGMSRQQDKTDELKSLLDDIIAMKGEQQKMKKNDNNLICNFNELFRKAGAIINEADISLEMKQNLMMTFRKFIPLDTKKAGDPDAKLVIDGDVFMEYVENTVHDVEISVESKQEIITQFRGFVDAKVGKTTVVTSLAAKHDDLLKRINDIESDANLPKELIEIYSQLRDVEKGKPVPDTIRSLSRRGKKPGEVLNPRGLTINQNEHILVSDYRYEDSDDEDSEQPGSVKTVTADTAQILTSVTVHGLPHRFSPWDTKMADNGDYYTADRGNKCIVVSDAKSKVKQIIAMGKLKRPTGVFVDKDRNVFIADYDADCVIKCNGDGDIISSQQLSKPWSLTMNSKYQLIVSCRGDENCIYVLDSNLEILNQFGSDHLVQPWGVTVDNADNIYVADDRKIVKFDRQGEYQETVTEDVNPYDIAVFTDGRIVCSDVIDSTVKVIYK